MTGVKIELLIEFGVILLAPIIHTLYLWKYKKVNQQILKQNIRIFGVFYVIFALVLLFLLWTLQPPVFATLFLMQKCYISQSNQSLILTFDPHFAIIFL